jgi:tRNA threonylcarbamoyladenosine biosynthesis protein TsaB
MKVLALELSSSRGSMAWLGDDQEPTVVTWPADRKHSGVYFENLLALRNRFGLPDRIVVGLGPGSYAGVRIAIAAGIGLHYGTKIELVGLPSICAMKCDAPEYYVIGDARRSSFFVAMIQARQLVEGPLLLDQCELQERLDRLAPELPVLTTQNLPQFNRAVVCFPSAAILARLGRDEGRAFALPPLEPMYLREPHITMPKEKQRHELNR